MKYSLLVIAIIAVMFTACKNQSGEENPESIIIGKGQMPNAINDESGNLHLVFGRGDSIMYASSIDKGKSFSKPVMVSILPGLAASHMRGPQIAASLNGLTIIACNEAGNIFSYNKTDSGKWLSAGRVNDVDTVAKENLMALDGNDQILYAVWLDLRDKHNKIVGASSHDGGKVWSKNVLVYASPDTTVCECCKPSVVVKDKNVYVMFRNWLNGNRDLYLIQSGDSGLTFKNAQKLGNGNWALNGCPMDGGSLVVKDNNIQTVWNRKGKIYTCEPGKPEKEIGNGRGCTLETVDSKMVYAWTEKGEVVCLLSQGKKSLGKGQSPVIKAIGKQQVMCIWESENEIHSAILNL
jgi:hypothetical protein